MTQTAEAIETWLDEWTEKWNKYFKKILELKWDFNELLIRILDISEEKLKEFEINLDIFSNKKKFEEFNKKLFWIMNWRKEDILEIIKQDKSILTLIWYDYLDYNDDFSKNLLMEFIKNHINYIFREIEKNNRIMNSFN